MMKLSRLFAALTVLSVAILLFMVTYTRPTDVGPFGILVVFVCLYIVSISSVMVSFLFLQYIRSVAHKAAGYSGVYQKLSRKTLYYYSTIIASAPVLMIGLRSVGSLSFYSAILVLLFVAIGIFYVRKRI